MKSSVKNLTENDKIFIDQNYQRMTVNELSTTLKKSDLSIRRYLRDRELVKKKTQGTREQSKLIRLLHLRYYWDELTRQFTEEELQFFEKKWVQIYSQFGEDVTPTEESSMVELIRINILINRLMRQNQEIEELIANLKTTVDLELAKPVDKVNTELVSGLQMQIATYMSARSSFTKEYAVFLDKMDKYTTQLKADRQSRKKRAEDASTNFNSFVRYLEEEGVKTREGEYAEILAVAGDVAERKLGELHEYTDGTVDRCLLNKHTVKRK